MREMADDNGAPWLLQVSLKSNGQSLINVRGMNATELREGLDDIIDLSDKIAEAETAVGAVQMVKQAMPGSTSVPAPPPAGASAPAAVAPMCECGRPAKFVQGGVSRAGRPYKAFWACANPQGQQCRFRADA